MAFHYSPKIVTNNLKMYLDPANIRSYASTGDIIYDLSPVVGLTYSFTLQASWNSSNGGVFSFPDPITTTASMISSGVYQNSSSEMTIDVWFKRTKSNNTYNMIWSYYLPYLAFRPNNKFYLSWRHDDIAGNQRVLESTNTYSNNVWYNVSCTITNSVLENISFAKIYVNGVLESISPTYTGVPQSYVPPVGTRFMLGNWSYGSEKNPFEGSISNFKLYDRILSDSEILQNFNALKSRFGL
jgi:hypothetical protein